MRLVTWFYILLIIVFLMLVATNPGEAQGNILDVLPEDAQMYAGQFYDYGAGVAILLHSTEAQAWHDYLLMTTITDAHVFENGSFLLDGQPAIVDWQIALAYDSATVPGQLDFMVWIAPIDGGSIVTVSRPSNERSAEDVAARIWHCQASANVALAGGVGG